MPLHAFTHASHIRPIFRPQPPAYGRHAACKKYFMAKDPSWLLHSSCCQQHMSTATQSISCSCTVTYSNSSTRCMFPEKITHHASLSGHLKDRLAVVERLDYHDLVPLGCAILLSHLSREANTKKRLYTSTAAITERVNMSRQRSKLCERGFTHLWSNHAVHRVYL